MLHSLAHGRLVGWRHARADDRRRGLLVGGWGQRREPSSGPRVLPGPGVASGVRAGPGAGDAGASANMNPDDTVKLLHGPYTPPKLNLGEVAPCLYRDRDVIITGISNGP